jgi:tRNA(adenine34) deaminase
MDKKEMYMQEAIVEALKAKAIDEVPVGAIIVKDGEIIARAHNTRETEQISTHHAEILALNEACKQLGTWRLEGCDLYVTLEPCIMCAGSLILSRVQRVIFGASDPKAGAVVSVDQILDHNHYNHSVSYEGGILESECSTLLKEFFSNLRKRKKS